jgi:hypothetical protein
LPFIQDLSIDLRLVKDYLNRFRFAPIVLGAGVIDLSIYLLYILISFHFAYTDMDQLIMWYGASEFQSGDFHMFRYFGQNYGTMLEALVGSLFAGVPYHIALPTATLLLFLTPYFMMGKSSLARWKWFLPVGFLLMFPPEYFMIAFMPRDFVTGIAVTSMSLFFINQKSRFSFFMIGLICIIGWSFQQNAALLGATISTYAAFHEQRIRWSNVLWMAAGYAVGGGLHLLLEYYYVLHPELIVHGAWEFHFALKQVWDGWKNLDRHFQWITPALLYQGWFYIFIFLGLLIWSYLKKQWNVFAATLVLGFITFASLGVLKIHDARDNVFFSHERMYLALPVAIFFLLSRIKTVSFSLAFTAIGLVLSVFSMFRFSGIKEKHLENKQLQVVQVKTIEEFYDDCERIHALAQEYAVKLFLLGPHYQHFRVTSTHGCQSQYSDIKVLFPEYERKTWDTRAVIKAGPTRFLWHNTGKFEMDERIQDIFEETDIPGLYLVSLQHENPIEFYENLGYKVKNY